MPDTGSTLSVGTCGFGACTRALAYSFVVRSDVTIPRPVFRVVLKRENGSACLSIYQTDIVPLVAGEPDAFAGDTLLFTTTPPGGFSPEDNNCRAPFTTTRITTELHDGSISGPVVLARDFDVTYQWVP